ncbi:unnamed protein product [Adineta steineri]|uniref:NHL repeat containing protein-like protein n=1 Tax=Adineta steineri TaxID=433720 RepID=A0A815G483_9BILA|nr:unnamed protein product [Adineta steineri]
MVLFHIELTTSSTTATVTTTTITTTTITTTTTTPTTTTATTTTTTTTTIVNPCVFGNLLWNTTGITVLGGFPSYIAASGVFVDLNDTLYAVDENRNFVVWKLMKDDVNATVVAGTLRSAGTSNTTFHNPNDVYVDRYGNIYVVDTNNHRIQKFSSESNIGETIAGLTGIAGSALNQLDTSRYFTFDLTDTQWRI